LKPVNVFVGALFLKQELAVLAQQALTSMLPQKLAIFVAL